MYDLLTIAVAIATGIAFFFVGTLFLYLCQEARRTGDKMAWAFLGATLIFWMFTVILFTAVASKFW